ncbi:UNKNOWN [Stylonychia lemnae]|uniref:very-long-chain (3R)-3-hydroxyacyl-CoA dehydratase n=1 Tax=Stylonychia lemnae TaxID=5949 RepID=A0A078AWQ3_STYLE|nr:UNKNOWN [Stylonychia lemnae]|eukprot:CDW85687.1 UNKNOWN [Stylonychia lemnae]
MSSTQANTLTPGQSNVPFPVFGENITKLHNFVQTTVWFSLLFTLLFNLITNFHDTQYRIRETMPNFILFYQLIQIDQAFEVSWQKANVMSIAMQTLARLTFGIVSLPYFVNEPNTPIVTLTLMMFCLVESFRYAFYLIKQLGKEDTSLGRFLGIVRYNSFIICYPIGALGDWLVLWWARGPVYEAKLLSVEMPNTYNFTFRFGDLMAVMGISYFFVFPQIYLYLLQQRKRYFLSQREQKNSDKKDE